MPDVAPRATFGRVEIPSADPAAAARFFHQALGWPARTVPWAGGGYLALEPPAGPGAGVTDAATLGSESPLAVVHVEGAPLAAWLERIVAAGGTVAGEPREIDGMGRFARFRDPEGHLFGIWQPTARRDWQAPAAPAGVRAATVGGQSVEVARWSAETLRRLTEGLSAGGEALAALPAGRLEAVWCETVEAFRDRASAERTGIDPALAVTCRLSPQGLAAGLEAVLGGVAGTAARRLFSTAAERRGGAPRTSVAPVLVILASNLPALAVQPLLPALALGRPAILKSPRAEPLFAPAFAAALVRREPALAPAIAALTWPGGDAGLEAPLLAAAGPVVAYGETATLEDLARRAGTLGGGRLIAYGPKSSLAVVDRTCDPAAVAPGLARDVALFDQRGCLSLAAVYTDGDAEALAGHLARELAALARRWPPYPPAPRDAAAVQQLRAEAELHGWPLHSLDLAAGTVVVDPRPAFRPTPGLRTVRIHPLDDLATLPTVLAPWKDRLQGAALAGPAAESLDLGPLGISRTAPPGELQSPDASWHNGGIHPLDALSDP